MRKQAIALKFTFIFVTLSMLVSLVTSSWHLLILGQKSYALLVAEVLAGLVLTVLPYLLGKIFHFYLPNFLYFFFMSFIYCAIYLGDAYHFYYVAYWDKFLHVISGALLFGAGLAVLGLFTKKELPAAFICLYGIAFAVFCGVLWECYEFTCDGLFNMNLQRYLSGNTPLVGRAALMDTMGDLIADLAGAFFFSLWAHHQLKSDPTWIESFFFKKRLKKK